MEMTFLQTSVAFKRRSDFWKTRYMCWVFKPELYFGIDVYTKDDDCAEAECQYHGSERKPRFDTEAACSVATACFVSPHARARSCSSVKEISWEHSLMTLRIFFTHNSSQDELLSGNEWSNRTDRILLGRLRRFLQGQTSSLLIFHARSTTRGLIYYQLPLWLIRAHAFVFNLSCLFDCVLFSWGCFWVSVSYMNGLFLQ